MAQIDAMQLELDSYTENANLVRDMVLLRLLKDKVITDEQADVYSDKWVVVCVKNTWFKHWMNKFSKKEGWSYKFVKFED